MTTTGLPATRPAGGGIAPSALQAIETAVTERQRLIEEWRMKRDNSLPPQETVFTAYNITKEVQKKYGEWAPHSQVRDLVHDAISRIMQQDECLIDIPGVTNKPGVERPRLYHPPEISHQVAEQIFNNYGQIGATVQFVPSTVLGDGGAQSQLPLPGPQGSIAVLAPTMTSTAAPGTGGQQPDGTYLPDKRGRIWVPADMLRKLGAGIGSTVYVTKQGSDLSVTTALPGDASEAHTYRVDPSNNIAISKSAFDEAGMASGKYRIIGCATEIQVKNA